MSIIVGVRFKPAGKVYYFKPGNTGVVKGDDCIVETIRGVECGQVVVGPREITKDDFSGPINTIIRKATDADREKVKDNKRRERDAEAICLEKIKKHKLPMHLVEVEYTFDNGKLIFYFTAEGRIDFRELVRDLAFVFRTRIELRQIGVRDEAKIIGGIGACGRPICCKTFLGEFAPVSIRMAKEQHLPLNPSKISGLCGRLMCCLRYEDYRDRQDEDNNLMTFMKELSIDDLGDMDD